MGFLSELRSQLADMADTRATLSRKSGDTSTNVRLLVKPDMAKLDDPTAWERAADDGIKPAHKLPVGLATGGLSGLLAGDKARKLVHTMTSTPEAGAAKPKLNKPAVRKTRQNANGARPVATSANGSA